MDIWISNRFFHFLPPSGRNRHFKVWPTQKNSKRPFLHFLNRHQKNYHPFVCAWMSHCMCIWHLHVMPFVLSQMSFGCSLKVALPARLIQLFYVLTFYVLQDWPFKLFYGHTACKGYVKTLDFLIQKLFKICKIFSYFKGGEGVAKKIAYFRY